MPVSPTVIVAAISEMASNLPSQTTGTDDQQEDTWQRELADLRWVDGDLMGRATREAVTTLRWFPPLSEFLAILQYVATLRDAERDAAAVAASRVDYDPDQTTPDERERWAKEDADIAGFWAREQRERASSTYLDERMTPEDLEFALRSYRAVERLYNRRFMSPAVRRETERRTEAAKAAARAAVDAKLGGGQGDRWLRRLRAPMSPGEKRTHRVEWADGAATDVTIQAPFRRSVEERQRK